MTSREEAEIDERVPQVVVKGIGSGQCTLVEIPRRAAHPSGPNQFPHASKFRLPVLSLY